MRHKLILPILAVAVLALAFPLQTALAQGGVVQGTVINKTTGEPVPEQLLELHVTLPNGREAPVLEATSGPNGTFAFEGVEPAPGTQLALCATYLGVMYHDPFEAPAEGFPVSRDILVYETTSSDETISVTAAHVIFYPKPEQSAVEVLEFFTFQNSGNRTYVGATKGGVGNPGETLHFTLPQGASNGTLHQGLSEEQVTWHEGGFCSLAPVFPGEQQIVYYYGLPYSGKGKLQFVRPIDYRPAEILVMTSGNQGQVTGQGVVSQGPMDLQEEGQFGVYSATLSPSQDTLNLELSGLGGGSGIRGNFKFLAGGLTGLGLIGGLFLAVALKRRRALVPAMVRPGRTIATDPDEEEWDDNERK
ncbi:MAG: cytochrome c family protein [Dehalococcoidia bacterium]|nr:cytochrome c family protein [Dehalococcoidia bacterium]